MSFEFSQTEKDLIYRLFRERRDVRQGFTGEKIDPDVLKRILQAAHHAPSVGFMQPWNFILIEDKGKRQRIQELHLEARKREADNFSGARKELYNSLKLAGILESTINICVTCDRQRSGKTGLGRSQQKNMDLYSTVCAIQNMWLAARAEGIGLGWVSILDQQELARELEIPEEIELVAYLCVGPVDKFAEIPELEEAGWEKRRNLDELVYREAWGQQ